MSLAVVIMLKVLCILLTLMTKNFDRAESIEVASWSCLPPTNVCDCLRRRLGYTRGIGKLSVRPVILHIFIGLATERRNAAYVLAKYKSVSRCRLLQVLSVDDPLERQ